MRPVLKTAWKKSLEAESQYTAFKFCDQFQRAPLHEGASHAQAAEPEAARQGLTLVHFSAQCKHFFVDNTRPLFGLRALFVGYVQRSHQRNVLG
jgi:hypothetical protein